jgi:hypothetical protein
MEYGLAKGMAVDLGFNQRVQDLRYQEEMARRQKAESEAKAKLFADDLAFQNAANSFDNPRIKEFAKAQIQKIGDYVSQNPDWETNVNKRAQLNLLKRELKDNPELIRGVQSDSSYKELITDLQEAVKAPEQHDMDAYNEWQSKWSNYTKFGNQDGEEAAKLQGTKAFTYQRPKNFIDINKSFAEVGNKFKDMKVKSIKGGMGAYEEYADPKSLQTVAAQMYSQNKRQFDKLATQNGVDPMQFIMQGIDAHISKKRDLGDYGLQKEMAILKAKKAMEGGGPVANTFKLAVKDQVHSNVASDLMDEVLGDGARTIIRSKDGGKVIDITGSTKVSRTGYNFKADPTGKNPALKGVRYAEGVSYIPLEQAYELGIVEKGGWFGDDSPAQGFKDFVTIESKENKDGKIEKIAKVIVFSPFDENNQAIEGKFNAKTMTTKQRPLPTENSQYNQAGVGDIITNKKTGKKYRIVEGGYEEL